MKEWEYSALDGVALADLIARGEVSREQVTAAAIGVIESRNPDLNAVIRYNFDGIRDGSSEIRSMLDGVPFLLKDANLYSSGMPTTFGSAFFRDAAARPDSLMVDRWRKAGLSILGKTNTPEFAAEFVTEPRAYGTTKNPRAPGLTVGGSSGGAAAAVAAGMVPIAHATDLGGSIRIPAACCGVFGFKPTAGLNPVGPYFAEIAGGLNSDHVVTRSVRDSAASLDITAGRKPEGGSYLKALHQPTGRLRIGISAVDPMGRRSGAEQQQALSDAARLLEGLGHDVFEYVYPEGLSAPWFDDLWIFDIVKLVDERAREIGRSPEREELEPLTWHLLEKAKAGGPAAHAAAQTARIGYNTRYLGSMQEIDIVLTPTLAANPPKVGTLAFTSFDGVDAWNEAGYGFAPFSTPSNISGQPSASCPWFASTSGLSIGVQISGKPGGDLLVLQLAAQLEEAR
ncbi:amidase [Shinella sp. CPCC 101442]|uniref:amidase n=1 Tax=Shinella sp. CPCC 101442 TaxID=2932265 RepID=UPI002153502E|nr:amidase [Shinella sp. CPCC 101442]MCR6497579.1 amidase [Shinella sp. CPCC 101442]